MNLTRRIECNLKSVYLLATHSIQHKGTVYLKLPVGLLTRNCLMDCILILYTLRNNDEWCNNIINLWNRDYIKAFHEEFEVYKDKLSLPWGEKSLRSLFLLEMEDRFINDLVSDEEKIANLLFAEDTDNIDVDTNFSLKEYPFYLWKVCEPKDLYPEYKKGDGNLKSMKDVLTNDDKVGSLVKQLYAYYKYFSQYEHYSERGHGDSLVDFGNDNIRFEKVFDYIESCTHLSIEYVFNEE